jgi:ferredoxin-type protein NapG
MVPDDRPCAMCEGFPCVQACPEGALMPPPPDVRVWKLGVIELDASRCLPFRGPECGACRETCPEGAEGALRFERNRPVIDETLCVGCGQCVDACIVAPKALSLRSL